MSCCCVLVALGVMVGVLASQFTVPEVDVKRARILGLQITAENATMSLDVMIEIKNPNDWPFEAKLTKLYADVWSLDTLVEKGGEAYYMNNAALPEPAVVGTQSQVSVLLDVKMVIKASGDSLALFSRLNRDCGPTGAANSEGEKETKLRIKLVDPVADVAGVTVDLTGHEIEFETLVSCGNATTTGAGGTPGGTPLGGLVR